MKMSRRASPVTANSRQSKMHPARTSGCVSPEYLWVIFTEVRFCDDPRRVTVGAVPVFTDGPSAWKFVSSIHPHMRATSAGRQLTRRKFIALLGSALAGALAVASILRGRN